MEEGRHAALVERGGLYAEMWARQVCPAADQDGVDCSGEKNRNFRHSQGVCTIYEHGICAHRVQHVLSLYISSEPAASKRSCRWAAPNWVGIVLRAS